VKLWGLAARNLFRSRVRTILTVLGGAVAVVTFVVLRTAVGSWTASIDEASQDRIVSRHKVTIIQTLPKRYVDEVRGMRGVKAATYASWFGGKDPKHEHEFFAQMAVDTDSFFKVYDEMVVSPAELEAWRGDPMGTIVGDALANKLGWKVGDKIILQGTIYSGDWEFRLSAIYKASRKSVDRSTMVFHWKYLNDRAPEPLKEQIGWIVARVADPTQSGALAASIDRYFDSRDVQTLSQSERAFNLSFLGMFSAVLKAIDIVSIAIMVIMMLILGNTIAMGVRERTSELGILRALGFSPAQIVAMILGEAGLVGLLAAGVGLGIAYPFVHQGMGRYVEENMGAIFPFFRINTAIALAAVSLSVGLGLAAALPTALRVWRLKTVDAIRHVA
jgi:putative ABC transport system permease protein